MAINYTGLENVTTFLNITTYVNNQTDGLFGVGFLLLVFVVFFTSLSSFDNSSSFAAASVVSCIMAILMYGMGLIAKPTLFATIVLVAISFIVLDRP